MSYKTFPKARWRQILSTNPLECGKEWTEGGTSRSEPVTALVGQGGHWRAGASPSIWAHQ